jgi:predicted RNase H-like HicB family nuclease
VGCRGRRSEMDFFTAVLRKSGDYWIALCLENGLVGQGETREKAMEKIKEAVGSFEEVRKTENDVYNAPISIKELHEFLMVEVKNPASQHFELRAVYA